jgi:hypothetical protein
MGHIKEPLGIDFFVDATPLTLTEKQKISEVIAYFKSTGKKMISPKTIARKKTVKREMA